MIAGSSLGVESEDLTLETHDNLAAVDPEWEDLAARTDAPPFVHPGWIKCWFGAFGGGDPQLLVLRRRGTVEAVLPTLRRMGSLRSPTNSHTPAFGPLASDAASSIALADAVLRRRMAWLDFSHLDPDDSLTSGLEQAGAEAGWRAVRTTLQRSPYLEIKGEWASFESRLPKDLHQGLARRRRRLEREGKLSFEFLDGRSDLDRLLDQGFAIEGSGWKTERGTAISSRPQTEHFYRAIAHWAAERGWLRLGFARLGTQAIAFELSLEKSGRIYALKKGFDPSFGRFSPGVLLRRESVKHAFDHQMRSFEFCGTDDPHKLRWTRTVHEKVRLQLFPPAVIGTGGFVTWRYGRPAARSAKHAAMSLRKSSQSRFERLRSAANLQAGARNGKD